MPNQNKEVQIVISVDAKDLKSGGTAAVSEIAKIGKAYERLKKSQAKLNKIDYARGLFNTRPHREIRRENKRGQISV